MADKRSKAGGQNMRVGKVFQKKIYGVPAKVRVTKITWNLGKSKLPVLVEVEDVKTRRLYRYWSYAKSLVSRNPRGKRKTRRRALNKLGIRRGWSLRLRYPMRSKRKSLNSRLRKRKKLFSGMGLYLPSRRILKEIMADPERRKKLFSDAAKEVRACKRKRGKNVGRRFVYPVEGPQLFRLSSSIRKRRR